MEPLLIYVGLYSIGVLFFYNQLDEIYENITTSFTKEACFVVFLIANFLLLGVVMLILHVRNKVLDYFDK